MLESNWRRQIQMTQINLATAGNLQNWSQYFNNLKSIKKVISYKEIAQPERPALRGSSAVMRLANHRKAAEKLNRTSERLEGVKKQNLGYRIEKPTPTQDWEIQEAAF